MLPGQRVDRWAATALLQGRQRALVALLAPLRDQRGVQALAPEQGALASLVELLVLLQDPQLVGSRVGAWRPGPLGHLRVGHPLHAPSVRPQLGGGHRRHRLWWSSLALQLIGFYQEAASPEADREGPGTGAAAQEPRVGLPALSAVPGYWRPP